MTYKKAIATGHYAQAVAILARRDRMVNVACYSLWTVAIAMGTYLVTGLLP